MKRRVLILSALFAASAAQAQSNVSVGVTGGTLGVGPEVGVRIDRLFGLRANATFLGFDHSFTSDDLRYDGHAHLGSYGGMVDLYPFGGGFRISGGARYNQNKARAVATPAQNTSVGGLVFTPAQIGTLSGHADVRNFAPAATIGWGGKPRKGFTFGVEGGALFQGRVHISDFTSSTGLIPQARLDQERDSLQHDVDKYHVYPIAQVSMSYRF